MEKYLKRLYKLALKAYTNGDVPVGAIVINNGKVIGKGYNNRQKKGNVVGHAEINAIVAAEKQMQDWRLNDCILITTLSPCDMCYEIIEAARISKIYYIIERKNYKSYPQDKYEKLYFPGNNTITKYSALFEEFFKKLR